MTCALWRRLDAPGHDACRLVSIAAGWRLEGTAIFLHDGKPARLDYHVECDLAWRSRSGGIEGWLGARPIELSMARSSEGAWTLDDEDVPDVAGCVDLDYGFTPATNLLALRRAALPVGQCADLPAAWLDLPARSLRRLPQRLERRDNTTYQYDAPSVGYSAALEIGGDGFVRSYPGLWEREA